MATHTRDSAPEVPVSAPKDRRVPLKVVCFREPTALPGITSTLFTTITAGERRVVDGKDWLPPAMWLDQVLRVIKIEDRAYPLERVHYMEQAKMVTTRPPPPLDLEQFTIGKRKK